MPATVDPMKYLIAFIFLGVVSAEDNKLRTPTAFEPRNIDGSNEIEPNIRPENQEKQTVTRTVTHCVLTENRTWTSTDGKKMEAKLIAFEDLVVESVKGQVAKAPQAPEYPTVVQEEKVRFSVNRKPVVLPLARLIQSDQDFIEKIRLKHAAPAPTEKAP